MRRLMGALAVLGGLAAPVRAEALRDTLPAWAPIAAIRAEQDAAGAPCRYVVADLAPGAPPRARGRFTARPGSILGARWQPSPANRTLLGQMAAARCADDWDSDLRDRFWRALGTGGAFVAIDPAERDPGMQWLGLYAPNVGLLAWIAYTAPG